MTHYHKAPMKTNLKLVATMFPFGIRKSVIISGMVVLLSLPLAHARSLGSGFTTDNATGNPVGSPCDNGNATVAANTTITVERGTRTQPPTGCGPSRHSQLLR